MEHGEAATTVRKLTLVSGNRASLFTLLPVMLPSYISPENAAILLLNRVCLASDCWCVVDAYVSLCLCEWRVCQGESNRARKSAPGVAWSLSSILLLFHWCIIAILPRMIANSYECERVWVKARGGGGRYQNKWLSTGFDPICGEICVLNMLVFVSELSIQTESQSLFLSPPSHPNRVPLPGHEGGGEWGSGVNQGSWIYRWQTSLPPWAPVSSMRLWPLGGMGLTLSFCVYIHVWVYGCVCVCDVHPIIIGRSNLPAPRLPPLQQLERGEPEFSMSTCSVTVRTCENPWTTHT